MKQILTIGFIVLSSVFFCCKKGSSGSNESTPVPSSMTSSTLRTSTPTTSPLQWQLCIGTKADDYGNAIARAGDGGYFVAGNTVNDGYLAKLNSNHQVANTVTISGTGVETINSIVPTDDGGCMIAGGTSSPETPGFFDSRDMLIAKFDVTGNMLWKKAIGLPGSQQANAIIKTTDGNFALTGYSDAQLPFIKIDPQGNILQQVYYSYSAATSANFGYAIAQASDGFVISGWTHVPNNAAENGMLLVKVFNNGTTSGARFYTGFDSHGFGITSNADNSQFAITGSNANLFVLKVDAQLNKITDQTFGAGDGRSIISTLQGYLIIGTQSNDLVALQVDNSLNVINNNSFGGGRNESGRSVVADTDGGYVVVGSTNSTNGVVSGNHGGYDMWTVKFKY